MKAVVVANAVILLSIFGLSSILTGWVYKLLRGLSDYQVDVFLFLILFFCLLLCYFIFLIGVLIYYKLVLLSIKEREGVIPLTTLDRDKRKQVLRVILDTIIVGLLSPLKIFSVRYLNFLGAKIEGLPVLRGKIFNAELVEIGDGAILGEESMVFGHLLDRNILIFKRVKIGQRCTIGVRSVILQGVEIGEQSIVAVGAVVGKDTKIPPREIWGGIPAKKIGDVRD